MSHTTITYQLPDIDAVAKQLLQLSSPHKIFLFYGEMGAGKTTLIKALCKVLGVEGTTSSPTFSLVNEYVRKDGKIYHFDFYRLKKQEEALDMGCEEYFYSGDYCFIEWPEKIPDLLPEHYTEVRITEQSGGLRQISMTHA